MLGGGDLESLKQNLANYNKSSEISYGLGDRFRDAVPTRAGKPIGITKKATALYIRWPKCGHLKKKLPVTNPPPRASSYLRKAARLDTGIQFYRTLFFTTGWHIAARKWFYMHVRFDSVSLILKSKT